LPRAATAQALEQAWRAQNKRPDTTAQCFADPAAALAQAVAEAGAADRIVVFGSFYTVGGVLHNGLPRLQAKHLGS
jgi:dihydrofolate synthase/folylpolyglutamate synthase